MLPKAAGLAAKRLRQNAWEITITFGPLGVSFAGVKFLPSAAPPPGVGRKLASTCAQLSRDGRSSVKSQGGAGLGGQGDKGPLVFLPDISRKQAT